MPTDAGRSGHSHATALVAFAFALASCAGTRAPEIEPSPVALHNPEGARWFAELTPHDPRAAREHLRRGLTTRDLDFVGIDQVSLAECIERVERALAENVISDDGAPSTELVDAVDIYLVVRGAATMRRIVGTDSCMPRIR